VREGKHGRDRENRREIATKRARGKQTKRKKWDRENMIKPEKDKEKI
jgi:hypothetical protein